MATSTSLITQVTGQAWVRGSDGSLTALQQGMRVPVGADIVTAVGGSVQLQADGLAPITIGAGQDVQLSADMFQPDVDPASAAAETPVDADVARVARALESGTDPFEELDPTAAVVQGSSGGDGGSSFTRLAAVVETTTPLGLEYPRPVIPTPEEIRLGGTGSNRAPELVDQGVSGTGLLDQFNDDSDEISPINVGMHFTDPDGHPLTFTATGLPPGLVLDPITGIISGTLDSSASQGGTNGNGIYNVVITATDPYGASTSLTFNWGVNNPPPVADDDAATTEENTVVTGNVLRGEPGTGAGRDSDPDGDKLVVTEVTNTDGAKVPAGSPITGVNTDGGKGGGTFIIHPDGSYTFTPGKDFDYLADGESTTTTVTYKISDGDGGFDTATLTITVTGSNDAPRIDAGGTDDAATITEIEDGKAGENTITHEKSGVIKFADADDSDTHTLAVVPNQPDYLGELTIVDNGDRTIGWTFKVDDKDIDYLAVGETLTQEYEVTVTDGNGAQTTQTVTITIVGTNDAPIIDEAGSDTTGAVTEDAADPTTSGTLVWGDADTRDEHTWTVTQPGQYGELTINDNGEWVYELDSRKADHLPAGETATDIIIVKVDDGNGGWDTQEIVITITGTNDVPVIEDTTVAAGLVKEAGHQEAGIPSVAGQLVASDADDNAVLTWSLKDADNNDALTLQGVYGSITLNAQTGEWTYTLNNDADVTEKLNVGDTETEVFKAYVSDGQGGVVEQNITVTVEGTNDAPVASADTDTVVEAGVETGGNDPFTGAKAQATGNVLDNDTDVDEGDKATLAVDGFYLGTDTSGAASEAGSPVDGKYGSLVLNADGTYTYTLADDSTEVQALQAGATATETFTYIVIDEHGATHQNTLTITITGTNDAPTITSAQEAAQGEVTEAGHNADGSENPGTATAAGTLTSHDVDTNATATWNIQGSGNGMYGTIAIDPSTGQWIYTLDNDRTATQALKNGDEKTETFTARVQDEHGAWAEQVITVTVHGTNDAPTATGEDVTFDEDPAGGAVSGNLLDNDANPEGGSLIVKNFTVADGDGNLVTYDVGDSAVDVGGIGTIVLKADGSYVFTPNEHYSGDVPPITYVVQEPSGGDTGEDGLTATAELQFTINPVADAPGLVDPADPVTPEDTAIALGLTAPVVTDRIDHNGPAGEGDNPELLGPITLTGIPAGVQLLDGAGNVLVTSNGGPITIVLSNPEAGNGHISGATGLSMTKEQFESLQVNPVAHDGNNFTVTVSVNSYEVDNAGNPLPGIDPAATTVDVLVDVQAVTDPVTLEFEDGTAERTVSMNEDAKFDLTSQLKAAFEDLDGSEQREIVIGGLPAGSSVFVNGTAIAVGSDGSFTVPATGQTGGIGSFPKIEIRPPAHFSGDIDDITVTLNAKDTDGDSSHATSVESDSVTLNLQVGAVAGDVSVGGVTGKEDTAIKFLANVKLLDLDGSETITGLVIKGVPADWVVKDAGGNVVLPDADGNYALPAGSFQTDEAGNLTLYKDWTVTPPAHSSKDDTFTLNIQTTDVDPVTHVPHVVDKDYSLEVTVTPVAEKVGGDTDGDANADLTMTGGHSYSDGVAGAEDGWFEINQDGFNLQAGWANEDGRPSDGAGPNDHAADGGTEATYALLTPVLLQGDSEAKASVEGAQFSYIDADGKEVILTYNGKDPVQIPMEFLDTVKFKAPPHVSGEFQIGVQAKTVDTDPDTGATVEAISGNATLEGIFIAPEADKVTLAVGGVDGRAQGDEDTAIGLSIRPTSSDPSETFTVRISEIPAGAVLTYDGVVVELVNGIATIPDFDSSKSLTITPPPNSNADFTLKVEAQSVDASPGGPTSESPWQTQDLPVRVDGVADPAEVEVNDVSFTEDQSGAGIAISLSELIASATLTDTDGSETLSFKITGLPDGFTVEGATFIGGEGAEREWVFTQDQLNSVSIKVPEHYSGKLPGELLAITTENDGHSTETSVDWSVDITPSPESDMAMRSIINEDQRGKVDFSIASNYGDTDEALTAVWIKVDDVDGKDFTLFLGENGPSLAEALEQGLIQLDSTGQYYELRGEHINNVYAQAGENFAGNQPGKPNPSFEVKYEVTDKSNDGTQTEVTIVKDGQHTLEVAPVTDPVELVLGDITGDGLAGNAADGVTLTSAGQISVGIILAKQPDAAAGNNPDHDGSEQFTQVVISGVPDGMLVDGLNVGGQPVGSVTFLGDGKWVISIAQDQYPAFTGSGIAGSVQFSAGSHLSGNLVNHPITITVVTQDSGATGTATDSETLLVSTDFADGGDPEPTVDVTFTQNPDFVGTEDTSFKLSEAFTGTVNGSGTHFTVVLTLPPGAQVSSGGQALTPTMIDGQEVWVISGQGDQAALDAFLDNILVTPPANLNDNTGGFEIDATFAAHLDNGSQDQAKLEEVVIPLTPVTDPAVIEVGFWAADENGQPTEEPAQEGRDVAITLDVASPLDGATALGDTLYVKFEEGGGLSGGILKDADGNPLVLQSVAAGQVPGLDAGDYYVIDLGGNATAPHNVNLIYTPAEGQAFQDGTLAVGAWVENQELGAENTALGTGVATGEVQGVNNGYDITVGTEVEPGSWVVTGAENQQGGAGGRIQLDVGGAGLVDTDSSESAFVALLKNLPAGFLVYVGSDAGSAVLAGNAGVDANGNNVWNIPLDANGMLPAYIAVQPPQNWSGTLEDVHLSVLSGENGQDTRDTTVAEFDLVVEAKADGILSFSPAPSFGQEGDIIQLNLNMVMADGKPAGETDQSHETITLTLTGLGEHAAFYVGGGLDGLLGSDHVTYDSASDTYTVSGLSQADADKLGFIQAAGAAQGEVHVKAWTVESVGGDASGVREAAFDLSIFDHPATSGDDTLLYGGGLLDGGTGEDTVWLRLGEDIDFGETSGGDMFRNIETIDLTRPGFDHELSNLSAEDVLDMTDAGNFLTIKGDMGDNLQLAGGDWTLDAGQSTEDRAVYTAKVQQGNQEIDVSVAVEGADFAAKLANSLIDQGKSGVEG